MRCLCNPVASDRRLLALVKRAIVEAGLALDDWKAISLVMFSFTALLPGGVMWWLVSFLREGHGPRHLLEDLVRTIDVGGGWF